MSMELLFGIIKADQPIICAAEVLGTKEAVVVGGVSGCLEFPGAPDWSEWRNPLPPPGVAKDWVYEDEPIFWGRPTIVRDRTAEVERMLLVFEVPEEELRISATLIHREFGRWWSLFNDYLELITRQRSWQRLQIDGDVSSLDLFHRGVDGGVDRPYERIINIVASPPGAEVALNCAQLKRITAPASEQLEPALELQVQLEAYRALAAGDHRKAIIEAAVAAEIALTHMIRSTFQSAHVAYGDKLLKRFRMLGGKLELSRIMGIPLPDVDFDASLVQPRNEVIHRADFGNEVRATQAVKATDELLRLVWPSLLQGT